MHNGKMASHPVQLALMETLKQTPEGAGLASLLSRLNPNDGNSESK